MKKPPAGPEKKLVTRCPFCAGQLFRLPPDLQDFVMTFLRCQGKIRTVEKELGISYPTVCKRLDMVNQLLGNGSAPLGKKEILEQLERGEISVTEATQLLKEKT